MIEPLVQIAPEENPNMFYGYGIIMSTDGDRPVIGHAGGINGFSSNLVYYPEEDLTIVVLSNLEAVQVGQIAQQLGAIALSR
jgi:CubicO group peptidase (beta-lactamase class C family)